MSDSTTVLKAALIILKTYCEATHGCDNCILRSWCMGFLDTAPRDWDTHLNVGDDLND